jgi:hypothetical protein
MKIPIAATAATVAALIAASMLGVASAEAPPAAPTRTISVGGVADVPIAQGADTASADAAYRQGLAAAVADGQSKAEFLAGKVGATLGSAQSVGEGGGSISCIGGEESGYVEYQGAQPDFGSPGGSVSPARLLAGTAAPSGAPAIRKPAAKRRTRHKTATGKAAAAGTCTLSAEVALAYAIG